MKHINIMVKPASGSCNMRCKYCFYNDVSDNRQIKSYGIMQSSVLEKLVERICDSAENSCCLAFQGGEPTLAGLEYYLKLIEFEKNYNKRHIIIEHAIQTNGLLLNDDWARFLKDNDFLVGLSIDGNSSIHDSMRIDANEKGTYTKVLKAAGLLSRYQVPFNILTVVTKQTAHHISQIYRSFIKNGWNYLQFIPCLDPYHHNRGDEWYSLRPGDYTKFLCTLFDLWYDDIMSGRYVYIRFFENIVGIAMGVEPESCGMLGHCSKQFVIEADGGVYPCDFYVMDEYRTGDIFSNSFEELDKRSQFFIEKSEKMEDDCLMCNCYPVCRGGCRRDKDTDGNIGKNYYCESYKHFFNYIQDRIPAIVVKYKNGFIARG